MESVNALDDIWDIDRRLWVISKRADTRSLGYIVDGGRTHFGRFTVSWAEYPDGLFSSLSDVHECSVEASYWLAGFLVGQHPPAWFKDPFFESDLEDVRFRIYDSALLMFRRTGIWRTQQEFCPRCNAPFLPEATDLLRALPSNPEGEYCFSCEPVPLETLWPQVVDSESPLP